MPESKSGALPLGYTPIFGFLSNIPIISQFYRSVKSFLVGSLKIFVDLFDFFSALFP